MVKSSLQSENETTVLAAMRGLHRVFTTVIMNKEMITARQISGVSKEGMLIV